MQFLEGRLAFAGEDGCRRIGSVLESRMNSITHSTPHCSHARVHNLPKLDLRANHQIYNVPEKSGSLWAVDAQSCASFPLKWVTSLRTIGFVVEKSNGRKSNHFSRAVTGRAGLHSVRLFVGLATGLASPHH